MVLSDFPKESNKQTLLGLLKALQLLQNSNMNL